MKLCYTKQSYEDERGKVNLVFYVQEVNKTIAGGEKVKIQKFYNFLKVTLKHNTEEYFFFENLFIDNKYSAEIISDKNLDSSPINYQNPEQAYLDNHEPSFYNKAKMSAVLDSQIAKDALEMAINLDSIKLKPISLDKRHSPEGKDWFETFKVETSIGNLSIGYGFLNGSPQMHNIDQNWPFKSISEILKAMKNQNLQIKKGLLLSIIGLDNFINGAAPAEYYYNPLDVEYNVDTDYKKAS